MKNAQLLQGKTGLDGATVSAFIGLMDNLLIISLIEW